MKPIIKWAGGKQKLLPQILPHIPKEYNWYHEPFLGGGALFWSLQPKKAIISDANQELVNFYQQVKDNLPKLLQEISNFGDIDEELFYELRDLDRAFSYKEYSDIKKAARFLFLNKTCYNGLYRVNKQGQFNTPYGKYKNPKIYNLREMKNAFHLLNPPNQISVLNKLYTDVLKASSKGDFVYFDPPYHSVKKTSFVSYNKSIFGEKDHIDLKNLCVRLTQRGVKFLLSNSYTDFTVDLFSSGGEFWVSTIKAKRYINSNAEGRGDVKEILVKNY